MPMPQVHFAVGMGAAALLGLPMLLWRRRWLLWLPLLMTLCGGVALLPDVVTRGRDFLAGPGHGRGHGPAANALFLHTWLDRQPALCTRAASDLAFQAVALMYLACAVGYAGFLRWGLPRMAEAEEALARLRRETASYRAVAPFVGVLPLLVAGAAVVWMLWPARHREAEGPQALDAGQWAQLVSRRMGVSPGQRLGIVHAAWDREGAWLCGDLGAMVAPGGPSVAELVEQAKANGCDFVALLDSAGPAGLAAARQKHPDMALVAGLVWDAPTKRGATQTVVLLPPQPREAEALADFRRRFARPGVSAEEALRWLDAHAASPKAQPVVLACPCAGGEGWPDLFSWRRTNGLFVGFLGLPGAERLSARDARSQWDPRVATVGGAWDGFLDRGFGLWGAATASGLGAKRGQAPFPQAEKEPVPFSPGEFARTHVWCRGRGPEAVLEGLRGGCAWAVEGAIVRALDFGVIAPTLERPARMGEVARVAPGDEVTVELDLDVPPTDFAGRPNQLDEVELVSNFDGDAEVVARFRNVREQRRIVHRLPPAADNNGGLGFYVRARGWRRLGDDAKLCFYTNPIRVLVRAGLPPPTPVAAPVRVAGGTGIPPVAPPTPPPTGKMPVPPVSPPAADDVRARLAAIGLPPSVQPIRVETFQKPPGRQWRGAHVSIIGDRGPALADEELRVELLQRIPLGEATRLFFRCYAVDCPRLALVARPGGGGAPGQAARELPDRQWVAFDLAFGDDLLPLRAAAARLRPPAEVQAIEWTAARLGPLSRFYITDVAVYDPTPASHQELALRQAVELDAALRETGGRSAAPSARQRAEAALGRLAAWRARLDPRKDPLGAEDLAAARRDLATLADEVQRLRWHDAMARTFALPDPRFAVTFAPPGQRISARNPAFRPTVQVARSGELAAAGGEAESVQLAVVALWDNLEAVAVEVSSFLPVAGGTAGLPSRGEPAAVSPSLALVDEVEVRPGPSLTPEQTGWMPDPLLPFQPFDVEPGGVRSLLLTVEAPPDLPPGDYDGQVTVQPRGHEPVRLAVRLHCWGFALQGQPLAVVGHLDEQALSARCAGGKHVPRPVRDALYGLLLRHRVCPVPLLGGTEAADVEEALYCAERGAALVVLREASSAAVAPNEAEVVRAAQATDKLFDASGRRCGALLLPLAPPDEKTRSRMSALGRALAREHPALLLLAGGDGEPPGDLMAHVWRRPLGTDPPRRPHDNDVDVRLSRTARREGWELVAATPDSTVPSLLLTCPLHHVRLLPWLAWQHGIRALFLRNLTRWREDDDLRDGVLLYPPVGGASLPRAPVGGASAPRAGDGAPAHNEPCGSLRLVALRDGVEDYACLRHLWDRARLLRARSAERHAALLASAERLLADAAAGIGSLERPCRDPQVLAALRTQVCREAERLEAAWWADVDAAKDLPPPPPEVAAKPGDAHVALTWARSPDPRVAAYNVYRARDPRGPFVRLNPAPVEGLAWSDRSVADGVAYHYLVRSCRDELVDGPRSPAASTVTRPAPRVVWLPGAAPRPGAPGPLRVAVRLEGPGTAGLLPLVRPQLAYTVGSAALSAFENMNRQEDGTWALDVPDPGWGHLAGKALRLQARIVDRQGRIVAAPIERLVAIE
ncbi:MAG: hypothetical protein FJ290_00435 [Planctomycetes bacterium]|nr:hypothetical protein [Planctomycetota bacterium]